VLRKQQGGAYVGKYGLTAIEAEALRSGLVSTTQDAAPSKRPTPLSVVGGTITAEQAAGIERHLEATKGARLAAAMLERGASQAAIDFWFGDAT
jgi:hypothetical protein